MPEWRSLPEDAIPTPGTAHLSSDRALVGASAPVKHASPQLHAARSTLGFGSTAHLGHLPHHPPARVTGALTATLTGCVWRTPATARAGGHGGGPDHPQGRIVRRRAADRSSVPACRDGVVRHLCPVTRRPVARRCPPGTPSARRACGYAATRVPCGPGGRRRSGARRRATGKFLRFASPHCVRLHHVCGDWCAGLGH